MGRHHGRLRVLLMLEEGMEVALPYGTQHRPLAIDSLEHDAARSPVTGLEPGEVALPIMPEDDLAHGQRSREGVRIGTSKRGCETPVVDNQLSVLHSQVIERFQLFAEVATCVGVEIGRRLRLFCDPLPRVVALLVEGKRFDCSRRRGVEGDPRGSADHFEGGRGRIPGCASSFTFGNTIRVAATQRC